MTETSDGPESAGQHRLDPSQTPMPPNLEHLNTHDRRHRPVPTALMAAFMLLLALGLISQPTRWLATPAYGTLMDALSPPLWGLAYLIAATSLVLSLLLRRSRWIVLATHMWPVILLFWWEMAFILRWSADPKTTVANVGAWSIYLFLVVWSAVLNDDNRGRHP